MKRLLVLAFLLLIVQAANATNINACTNLVNASSPYALNASITGVAGTCMNFTQNNIVLNMNGFTITGTNANNKYGINISGRTGAVVENGTIASFAVGVDIENSNNSRIKNVTVKNGNQSSNNYGGFRLITNNHLNITNNTVTNQTGHCYDLETETFDIFSNNIANNIPAQFRIHQGGNNTFTNTVLNNVSGLWITISNNLTFTNLNITNAGDSGIIQGVWWNNGGINNSFNNVIISGIQTGKCGIVEDITATNASFTNLTISDSACGIQDNGTKYYTNVAMYNVTMPINSTGGTQYFTNTTLGYDSSIGTVNWAAFNMTAGVVQNGTSVYFQPDFVSIDAVALPALNLTAAIKITTDAGCLNTTVFSASGLPASAAAIISNGTITGIATTCAAGVANFTVPSFTGYAMGQNFTLVQVFPVNGGVGNDTTNFQYNITSVSPTLTCNLYTDATLADSESLSVNGTINVSVYVGSGIHNWYVACNDSANTITTPTWVFTTSSTPINNTVFLSGTTQPFLSSPQSLFYDPSGNLNIMYFVNTTPTNTLYYQTIMGGVLNKTYNATLNATKQFLIGFREGANLYFFSYGNDNATRFLYNVSSSSMNVTNTSTTVNVTSNSYYDPMWYANTKNIPTITNQTGSFYLYLLPTTVDTKLVRKNLSIFTTQDLNSTNSTANSRKVVWQTIAQNSNLTSWFYAFPYNTSCGAGLNKIGIFLYNGSTQVLNATPNTACFNQANIEASYVFFEQYGNNTYALLSNLVGNTTIYQIEGAKAYTFNNTVSNPSRMFFIDSNTVVFFNTEAGTTYAYSCYFGAAAANCSRFNPTTYGISMPFTSGAMTASKRSGTSDVVANGVISNNVVLQLAYTETAYDGKFSCYDEMGEFRKSFQVQVLSNTTANVLASNLWGYVLPSQLVGSGVKRTYFTCDNGTMRLFIEGLNNNFIINSYSLNTSLGAYYTYKINDQYGQPVQGVTITAQRFSNANQAYVTIEQGITDVTGSATFFLQPFILYQFTTSMNGYVPLSFQFVPSGTTSITLVLAGSNGSVISLPTYQRVFNDVSFAISPNNVTFSQPNLTLGFQVVSTNGTIQYYGMQVIKKYNATTTTVYSQNISGQPAGGLLQYTATDNGEYDVVTWFQSANYSEYRPYTRMYFVGNASGLAYARSLLANDALISGWSYYFIAVIVSAVAAGFVSRYTWEGAGPVGLIVLWIFTLLNPNATIVCLAGATACVTPVTATIITTLMVVAGLYVTKNV